MRGQPAVTVSLPFIRAERTIVAAVQSVLAQTHTDLRLVVVNDGDPDPPWPLLGHLGDDRLVRFDLDVNRGRYYADAVVLAATGSPWFGAQDADDWSEPDRIRRYLAEARDRHAGLVVGAQLIHDGDSESSRLEPNDRITEPLSDDMRQIAHHCGLVDTALLRAVGGIHPGYRIGYDTLLVNLLRMCAPVAHVAEPLHHRRRTPGSLTTSRRTGIGSPARAAAARGLAALYGRARRHHRDHLDGRIDVTTLRARIAAIVAADIDPATAAAVERDAARLRAVLAEGTPPGTAHRRRPVPPPAPDFGSLLGRAELWDRPWAIDRETAWELAAHLNRHRPHRILECGSGASTVLLAGYAAGAGAEVVVLEHERRFAAQTRQLLAGSGSTGAVRLVEAPLTRTIPAAGSWYDVDLPGRFDFVLIDGPPAGHGRQAAMFALGPHLEPGWTAWLDDGHRDHERQCVRRWERELGLVAELIPVSAKGLVRLRAAAEPRSCDASDVVVTLLTGARMPLLRRTIDAATAGAPGLLDSAHVLVLCNSDDAETLAVLDGCAWIDRLIIRPEVLSVGAATSLLMHEATLIPGRRHVLHLEDDWTLGTADDGWLDRARRVLDTEPEVGQVRLRHRGEPVLPRHMVDRRLITWTEHDGWARAGAAHYTFNPSLVRGADLPRIFPAATEAEAQQRFLAAGFATAQLMPGAFHHTGIGVLSRRRAVRGRRPAVAH